MNTSAAIRAYNNVGIDSVTAAADPHKLICLLYQGALLAIANAKNGLLRNDTPAKGKAITHAMLIIGDGLNASLNKEVGGDLAHSLSALYDYMISRLSYANLHNDMEALDEVTRLLGDLKSAWDSIRPAVVQSATPVSQPQRSESLVYARG